MSQELPEHTEYADEEATLNWDIERDGRMADYATDDDAMNDMMHPYDPNVDDPEDN